MHHQGAEGRDGLDYTVELRRRKAPRQRQNRRTNLPIDMFPEFDDKRRITRG
jgi:hypothetical protein